MPPQRHRRRTRQTISPPTLNFASALPQRISQADVFTDPALHQLPRKTPTTMAPPPPPRRRSPVLSVSACALEADDDCDEPQPLYYNADALKSLNGYATVSRSTWMWHPHVLQS